MFAQEPAPQFRHWQRFDIGKRKKFTLTDLQNDTKYICCVLAQHNFGLAAMSKSLRFKTRSWWYDEELMRGGLNAERSSRKGSAAVSLGRQKSGQKVLNKQHSYHLAPPSWRYSLRRASSKDPMMEERDSDGESVHKVSITSSEYQVT
jgi:hypothetical protein